MLLRLIASVSPSLPFSHAGRGMPLAGRAMPPGLPVDTLKGAIRLSFATWRLSLPFSEQAGHHASHDHKIA